MTRKGFGIILLLYLIMGLTFGLLVPPFENLDELEHFGVIRYIAETGRLPVHGTPEADMYYYRQEVSQPPLYHLLSAGLMRLMGLRADDAAAFVRFNPRVVCGPGGPGLYDNKAIFYHNPRHDEFPWQGTLLTLHLLRAWSTALQAITVACTYALGRRAFPTRPRIALLGMAVVAFNPQFLLVASGVNNDNLATPLIALGLERLTSVWQEGLSARRAITLGLLAGLAGLTKLSGWLFIILAGLITLALMLHAPKQRLPIATTAALIPLVALLMAGWWFWRNWQLYHDVTALQPMLELVGRRDGSLLYPLRESGLMFLSFWGQIPCSLYPASFYGFYLALVLLALGGLGWGWRRFAPLERQSAALMAAWFSLVWVGWMRWDAITPAPGGRLLFPALPAAALLIAAGLDSIRVGRFKITNSAIALLALLALWTGAHILPGFFAPPPRYTAVKPTHSLNAAFGDAVGMIGYNISLSKQQPPTLDLTLYWQATAPITRDYTLAIQLVSPRDTTMRWNYNSWPGHGNYPTSAWQPGEIIADRYRFRLPPDGWLTQAWDVHINLYSDQGRLPVYIESNPAGDRLTLARLRVPGRQPTCPPEGRLAAPVQFGGAIALTHARVVPEQEETRVTLCWQALKPVSTDYTVFVHLYDGTGALVSNDDSQPMRGAFPTSSWQPGDIVLDTHRLSSLPHPGKTAYRIAVGLYNLLDGTRLPAYRSGALLPDAAAVIWPAP